MKQITLEDSLINAKASATKGEMKSMLENIEMSLIHKFGKNEAAFKAIDFAKKVVEVYGANYKSIKEKMDCIRNQNSINEDKFLRAYLTYASCEATVQLLNNGNCTNLTRKIENMPASFSMDFDETDQKTLLDAVKHLSNFILFSYSPKYMKDNAKSYFESLSEYAKERMCEQIFSEHKSKYKDMVIVGKGFKINGIKDSNRDFVNRYNNGTYENNLKKNLEEIILDKVARDEIVGNDDGISLVETEIPCLMHYDVNEKRNPFHGFSQYILLAGKSGTGKTMLAKYAMTLAKEIAEKNNKQLSLVKLNFEDRWQYGPLENIRHQLSEVAKGDGIYIIFIDEIDTKIPSRNNAKEGYKNEIVGEFLRFRGGDYINKGNYIVIATTNETDKLDTALLNVFKVKEVLGPATPDEKMKVLYNNLLPGIKQGYVKIENWDKIRNIFSEYDFVGRDIFNIAMNAEERYRRIASKIPYQKNAKDVDNLICSILSNDGIDFTTKEEDVIKSIKNYLFKSDIIGKSYLH